jgi:hypothetical protein
MLHLKLFVQYGYLWMYGFTETLASIAKYIWNYYLGVFLFSPINSCRTWDTMIHDTF